MKKLALVLIAAASVLAGCVAYEAPYRGGNRDHENIYRGDRDRDRDGDGVRDRSDRDRDGDGVPNRQDNRPNDPRRN
jgi:hypothetical protein